MKNLLTVILIALSCASYAQDYEQVSATKGIFGGLALGSTGWNSETLSNDEFLSGFGFHLEAGYGFNEKIAAFFRFEYASDLDSGDPLIPTYPSTQVELGARWNFRSSTKALRPFFQLTGSQHKINFLTYDDLGFYYDVEASGFLIGVGGGARYFIHPAFSVVAQLQADFGSYTTVVVENFPIDEVHVLNTVRFNFGATFHLSGL